MVNLLRTIVNFGVLQLTDSFRECQSFSIYCQVEREDLNASKNTKRQRPASFYGYAQGIYKGFVMWEKPITFQDELLYEWHHPNAVLYTTTDCQTKTILDTFDNLATALGLTPLGPYDGQVTLERAPLERILFKLFGKTTLYVRAHSVDAPEACTAPIIWVNREPPFSNLDNSRLAQRPPIVPVNEDDPNGYDLPSLPYDGVTDGGETYNVTPGVCDGCRIVLTWNAPGAPRFPGGPAAPSPNLIVDFPAADCPISLEVRPDDGLASFPKTGDFVVRNKNGVILNTFSSYEANPFEADIDNGFCVNY